VRLYGREFKFSQLMKVSSLLGLNASPLFFRALMKGPLVAFDYSCKSLEVYRQVAGDTDIPVSSLSGLGVAGNEKIWIDLSEPSNEMTGSELAQLCCLAQWKNPRVVVEIGTYKGFTTKHLSRNTSEGCRIFTVDLPPGAADGRSAEFSDPQLIRSAARTQRAFGSDPKITQILQDSTTVEWGKILDAPVDLALVDASHLYEHVRKDTEAIMRVLAPNGVVVWHDYRPVEIRRGVKKYLDELYRKGLPLKQIAESSFCIYQRSSTDDLMSLLGVIPTCNK